MKKIEAPMPGNGVDRGHAQLRALYIANGEAGRGTYDGFTGSEIAAYNRRVFGADDEAFPSAETWSRTVD